MPHTNNAGTQLIESFEERVLFTYDDAAGYPPVPYTGEHPPKGTLTIGYGHTGPDVTGPRTIDAVTATQLLTSDLAKFEKRVQDAVQVMLTPNEFAALVSFDFNTGAFPGSPGCALINQRQFVTAWDAHLCRYNMAEGVINPGLVRRRAAERELFFRP